ncbi:MAG: HAMP domain-containing protein [Candidatus Omnitrophica bacterium]|nr:HAMP domain-containing protein [Candidatus Omnitrophota bacterium]
MKLSYKISLYFLCASFICLSVALCFVYRTSQESLSRYIFQNLESNANSRTKHIETYLKMLKSSVVQTSRSIVFVKFLKTSSNDPGYKEAFDNAVKLLKSKQRSDAVIEEYMLLDSSGRIAASSDESSIGQDKSNDSYFLGAQKEVFIKDLYFSVTKKKNLMAVSAPLFDDNKSFLGVLVARVNPKDLTDIVIDRTALGETGEIYIVNKYGYMITPSRFSNNTVLNQKVDTPNAILALEHVNKNTAHEIHTGVFPDYRGIPSLGAHDYIAEMQWRVLAEIDESEAFLPLRKMEQSFVWIFFLVGALSCVLGQLISRRVSAPLEKLYKGAQIIGSGNLDYKVGLSSEDEIGDLSRALDKMSFDLRNSTASIEILNKEKEDRRKVEKELQDSEKRFYNVFLSSNTATLLIGDNKFIAATFNRIYIILLNFI